MCRLRISLAVVLLSLTAAATACGGGGGGGTMSRLTTTFAADQPTPGSGTVSMAEGSVVRDLVTLQLRATDISDVYGAAFDITYDPSVVSFEGWAPGTLLEQGGNAPNYTVVAPQAGTVVVGASRTGSVAGVDAVGSRTLIRLTFRVQQSGTTPISFRSASMTDDSIPPAEIPGLSWFGGSLIVV